MGSKKIAQLNFYYTKTASAVTARVFSEDDIRIMLAQEL